MNSKENKQQKTTTKKKTTYGMGKKLANDVTNKGVNIQTIQTVHTTQYPNIQPIFKNGQKT